MDISFKLRWQMANRHEDLDPRLLLLLAEIEKSGSLQSAARFVGVSYRTAWQIIEFWNDRFAVPLCEKQRGSGTRLTPVGKKLVETSQRLDAEFSRPLEKAAHSLNEELRQLSGKKNRIHRLQAFASHDLAIGRFIELCKSLKNLDVDLVSRGSLDALKQLHTNTSHLAGFHFPDVELGQKLASAYQPLLDDDRFHYVHLAKRQQGLMFRAAMKGHIKVMSDLKRRSLRFINRQTGSGTRTIFDHLLRANHIDAKDINGYDNVEFTHSAVAAMVSSKHADVGFGLQAAASEFKLNFLPVIEETYVIAFSQALPKETQNAIRFVLKHDALKKSVKKLPGYDATATGKSIHAHKLLNS